MALPRTRRWPSPPQGFGSCVKVDVVSMIFVSPVSFAAVQGAWLRDVTDFDVQIAWIRSPSPDYSPE